jgi:hypothetical protein
MTAFRPTSPLSPTAVRLAYAVLMTIILAGCHATVDAKWATPDDTVLRWQRELPTLPVEVRGALPNATNEQMAHAIPHAFAVTDSSATGSTAHVVVEAGGGALALGNAYCASRGEGRGNAGGTAPLTLTVTLCDGTRLVATSSSRLDPGKSKLDELPREIGHLENMMLIGIDGSPSHDTGKQG